MATQKNRKARKSSVTLSTWRPKPVAAFARECERSRSDLGRSIWQSEELRQRLLRLVTRDEMQSVWRQLSKKPFRQDVSPRPEVRVTRDEMQSMWRQLLKEPFRQHVTSRPELRDVFLRHYLWAAVYPGQPEPFWMSFPTKQKQQQTLGQIAERASALLKALPPDEAIDQYTVWDIVDRTLSGIARESGSGSDTNKSKYLHARQEHSLHEILVRLGDATRGRSWSDSGPKVSPSFPISSVALFALLPTMLRAITELAERARGLTLTKPPKKTKTAYRTAYIRNIARSYNRIWCTAMS